MIRWGILSTARIGDEFVRAARLGSRSVVTAIASRNTDRATAWADRLGIDSAFGSYEELLDSRAVDTVYIPLPNSMHTEWTVRALEHGKHVLCEKPMALTTADIEAIGEAAESAGKHVMEGFMFRHHPVAQKAVDLVMDGALGPIVCVRAWHGFTVDDASDIRHQPDLGGGALADLGCYCVAGALMVLPGIPIKCSARQVRATSGVDDATFAMLEFASGAVAMLDCSMRIPESAGLHIVGEAAQVEIRQPWFPHLAEEIDLVHHDGRREVIRCPGADSYVLEIDNFCRVIAGEAAPAVTADLSRRLASTLELVAASARPMSRGVMP